MSLATFNALYEIAIDLLAKHYEFDSVTREHGFKTLIMQLAYTFNNNICILLLGIHVEGHGLLGKIFDGNYQDFNQGWYEAIGQQFVLNYIINIVAWMANYFIVNRLINVIRKNLDQGCCKCRNMPPRNKTKTQSVQDYVALYGGSDYDFFYK